MAVGIEAGNGLHYEYKHKNNMKFFSKSSNLLIVLKPGLSAQYASGVAAVPTVSVRFKEGEADVPEGKLTEMMLAHPGYNSDFIAADTDAGLDPFAYNRQETEPQHVVTELKYGSPVARHVEGGTKPKLPPELAKIVQEMAVSLAKEMLPGMVQSVMKEMVENRPSSAEKPFPKASKKAKKAGRKPAGQKSSVQIPAPIEAEETVPSTENPLGQADVA